MVCIVVQPQVTRNVGLINMRYIFITLSLVLTCSIGCSRKHESLSDRAFLILCEQNQTNLVSCEIVEEINGILSQKPTSDQKDAYIALDPLVRLSLDNVDYMIEANEIILMDDYGTKIWESIGVKKKLIRASKPK